MNLTHDELEYLSAWAREEWSPACYELPCHRLQLCHGVSGAQLILLIKAWVKAERAKDQDILKAALNSHPAWPWSTPDDFTARFAEASRSKAYQDNRNTTVT